MGAGASALPDTLDKAAFLAAAEAAFDNAAVKKYKFHLVKSVHVAVGFCELLICAPDDRNRCANFTLRFPGDRIASSGGRRP